jgi:hypothetical protein
MPSSKYRLGNPIGFQRWVNADNIRGIASKEIHMPEVVWEVKYYVIVLINY